MNKLNLLFLLLFTSCFFGSKEHRWAGKTMGTTYNIKFHPEKDLTALQFSLLIKDIEKILVNINKEMSTYDPESDISKFNALADKIEFKIKEDFLYVFKVSRSVYNESHGAFDPTVMPLVNLWGFGPKGRAESVSQEQVKSALEFVGLNQIALSQNTIKKAKSGVKLDFSAIAKGYAVDKLAQYLESKKIENYLVEIGGELRTKGKKDGQDWKVGVSVPSSRMNDTNIVQKILVLDNQCIATSGDYRNFYKLGNRSISHTIDPRTGNPVNNGVASVSVIGAECLVADALATALMVVGHERGLQLLKKFPGNEAMFLMRTSEKIEEKYTFGFRKFIK